MGITVAIVEDDPLLRSAFAQLVADDPELACAGAFGSGEDAASALPALAPHVVLMDINLPRMSGIDCARRLREVAPDIKIVMLTTFDDSDRVFESLKAGASGYVLKRASSDEIRRAVRDVCEGGAPMSGAIARKVLQFFQHNQAAPEVDLLTDRERAVLAALSQGLQYKEISDSLGISINTVRKHIRGIYDKLHVNTRADAVRKLGRV